MASNFKIISHRNGENIHIMLKGDFDGNSAWELFHFIKEKSKGIHGFFINTKRLNKIYSFGTHTFYRLLKKLKRSNIHVLIMGDNDQKVLHENDMRLWFSQHHSEPYRPVS